MFKTGTEIGGNIKTGLLKPKNETMKIRKDQLNFY